VILELLGVVVDSIATDRAKNGKIKEEESV
jgi:hypothetical protein